MGCFQSKKDNGDIHPNVFRVVNIDETGTDLWSGQLEITETDLILYREGRDATTWPLASLRRYGVGEEIFSFESGRRCVTGEGIYAFRCRRAAVLFRTLQNNIQMRNVIQDTLTFQLPRNGFQSYPRQAQQASVVQRASIDNGLPNRPTVPVPSNSYGNQMNMGVISNVINQSPRSPSNSDILEVLPLCPRPGSNTNQVTNVYQVKDFKSREHNNNNNYNGQGETSTDPRHLYTNEFNRDLATLRNTLRQEVALSNIKDMEDENKFLQSRYMNEGVPTNRNNAPLSPTLSNASEHYAQLSIEQQEAARLYMNIVPNEANTSDLSRNQIPTTPLTPKQPEYCNFGLGKLEINSYANLALGEMADNVNSVKQMLLANSADKSRKFSESDTFPSMSPTEELEVNYAILDIETHRDGAKSLTRELLSPESQSDSITSRRGRHQSQSSLDKSGAPPAPLNVGYTTIDFEKTVALTSVATGHMEAEAEADSSRRLRHNTSNASGSPSSADKTK